MSDGAAVTVIYIADVSPLSDGELFAAAYGAVTAERKAKTDRYRFPKDKYLSLGAELLLRRALAGCGIELPDAIARTAGGKPYIPDSPVHFSLSHSGIYAMCAAAPFPVGCDVERITAAELPLAERWLAPDERAAVMSKPTDGEREAEFARIWTRKESYVKLTGSGMRTPFESFSVLDENAVGNCTFLGCAGADGYRFAVCGTGNMADAEFTFCDIRDVL